MCVDMQESDCTVRQVLNIISKGCRVGVTVAAMTRVRQNEGAGWKPTCSCK